MNVSMAVADIVEAVREALPDHLGLAQALEIAGPVARDDTVQEGEASGDLGREQLVGCGYEIDLAAFAFSAGSEGSDLVVNGDELDIKVDGLSKPPLHVGPAA